MCLTPITILDANKITHIVPCSKCPVCAGRRASAWSFRLMQEQKASDSAYFITLTYDTLSVPITRSKRMDLHPRHLQLFFKRIRKDQNRYYERKGILTSKSIKYYAVGEYGGTTKRPHYHMVIFNLALASQISKSDELILKQTQYDGKTPIQIKQWPYGHATVGQVNEASVGYTLKYIQKGRTVPQYKGDDRVPEFSRMSKGLGANYVTPAIIKWHTSDLVERVYCTAPGGVKLSMCRYYKDRIYTDEQRGIIAGHFETKMAAEQEKIYGSKAVETPLDYEKQEKARVEAVYAAYRKQKSKIKPDLL